MYAIFSDEFFAAAWDYAADEVERGELEDQFDNITDLFVNFGYI